MSATVAELESQTLRLTPEERALLADRLLASLSDPTIEEAWAVESQRRVAELESGAVLPIPIDVAIERARDATR